eukprot:CAMPEP_0194375768 /NCGR_PEP_ID=MMETSP0174-20130528/24327_1 /TAXON_ID=216777 /ORGANISM="Proboscia alata, Strain PI-D3" /LENGTH=719 /DNA_ID=CAMNT_0039156197 /DNA_START=241 /DNA_END=2400 /DNA_ORIENTATION=+
METPRLVTSLSSRIRMKKRQRTALGLATRRYEPNCDEASLSPALFAVNIVTSGVNNTNTTVTKTGRRMASTSIAAKLKLFSEMENLISQTPEQPRAYVGSTAKRNQIKLESVTMASSAWRKPSVASVSPAIFAVTILTSGVNNTNTTATKTRKRMASTSVAAKRKLFSEKENLTSQTPHQPIAVGSTAKRTKIKTESVTTTSSGKGKSSVASRKKTKTSTTRAKAKKKVKSEPATPLSPDFIPSKTVPIVSPSPIKKLNSESKSKKAKHKHRLRSSDLAKFSPQNPWIDLNVSKDELRPSATLTTGQCFNWIAVDRDDDDEEELLIDASNRSSFLLHPDNVESSSPPPTVSSTPSFVTPEKAASAWGKHDETEWVGPFHNNVVLSIRETPSTTLIRVLHDGSNNNNNETSRTEQIMDDVRDYFQLSIPLKPLYEQWSAQDCAAEKKDGVTEHKRMGRLTRIAQVIPGVRILKQDPLECLFSFICSSNNNIPRITQILSSLRERYGKLLIELPTYDDNDDDSEDVRNTLSTSTMKIFSFPTLEALQDASESDLRELGLGYRANYIIETRNLLTKKGGRDFLVSLRRIQTNNDTSHVQAADVVQAELLQFKGIGRKVADCVALFSLDQRNAIPVDVHVKNIAIRDYDDTLFTTVKSLTPSVYKRVGDVFRNRFRGGYAGWAHSLLFVAELPSFRSVLPSDIVQEMEEWKIQESEKKKKKLT